MSEEYTLGESKDLSWWKEWKYFYADIQLILSSFLSNFPFIFNSWGWCSASRTGLPLAGILLCRKGSAFFALLSELLLMELLSSKYLVTFLVYSYSTYILVVLRIIFFFHSLTVTSVIFQKGAEIIICVQFVIPN